MKPCPFCAEEIQDAAIKCKHCGTMLTGQPPVPAVAPGTSPGSAISALGAASGGRAGAAAGAMAAPTHDARILFEGHPSIHAWLGRLALAGTMTIAGTVLAGSMLVVYSYGQPTYALVTACLGAALTLAGLGWYFVIQMQRRSTYIRITNHTIDIETGLLGRRIETLQLWRIRDIDFTQSLFERLFGIARIHVLSHDQGQPDLQLRGLPGSRQLFTELRDAIALARQGRNVVGVVD